YALLGLTQATGSAGGFDLKKSFRCAWPEQRGGHLKSLFLKELLHDAVRQFFFVPACPFCAGMLYFSDKGQCVVRRFFRDKDKRLCESD
ncbi:MAG: hypothetical protein ACLVDL_09240, partial [Faecalibacterium prausnitzii]